MGRPLNKKYFGNRNIGSTSTLTDDQIGGEGIASISWTGGSNTLGSFRGNNAVHNPLVGLALPPPSIPTGVQATWTVLVEVESVTTGAGSVGLVVNDVYSYGTAPNFPECGNARWKVLTSSNNGTNATFQMTSYGTGINLSDLPGDTTTVSMTKVSGTGASTFTVDINWRIRSATIVEKGSGYIGTESFTVTLYPGGAGTPPKGSIVLTADTTSGGNQYAGDNVSGDTGKNVSTYNENAIVAVDVSDSSIVDIIKQENAHRYKVRTASTTKFLNLASPSSSVGLYIQATDSNGYDYWVSKLNGHKATVQQISGGNFASGTAVHWTFDAPDATSVKIRNA